MGGPKRASKIRKLFNLTKEDDVCQYVIKRPLPLKDGKKQKFAAPKIQRLVTPRGRVRQDPRAEAEGAEGGQGAAPQEDCFSEGVQALHQQPVNGQVAVVTFSCEQSILANLKQPAGKQLYLHVIV